jgi:hypothetical protein
LCYMLQAKIIHCNCPEFLWGERFPGICSHHDLPNEALWFLFVGPPSGTSVPFKHKWGIERQLYDWKQEKWQQNTGTLYRWRSMPHLDVLRGGRCSTTQYD